MEMMSKEADKARKNKVVKNVMMEIGKNLLSYICLMAPLAVVGSIWFEVTPVLALRAVYGGVILIACFVVTEHAMLDIGAEAGKKDDDLQTVKQEYEKIRKQVIDAGTDGMDEFLDGEIKRELEYARRDACRELHIDYKQYTELYEGKSEKEIREKLGTGGAYGWIKTMIEKARRKRIAASVYAISLIKPIDLTEDMLMQDGAGRHERGGVGKTGEEYCREKKGVKNTLWCIMSVFLVAGVGIGSVRQFSLAMLVYTAWALFMLTVRMGRGYKNGLYAYTVVQMDNYKRRTRYLEKFLARKKGKKEAVENQVMKICT